MAGVGGVPCTFVKGTSKPLTQSVELWTVPGFSGVGVLLLGAQDSTFGFDAILYDTHANVLAWYALVLALQGQAVSIVDDWGSSHGSCLVVEVSALERMRVAAPGVECRGSVRLAGVRLA